MLPLEPIEGFSWVSHQILFVETTEYVVAPRLGVALGTGDRLCAETTHSAAVGPGDPLVVDEDDDEADGDRSKHIEEEGEWEAQVA